MGLVVAGACNRKSPPSAGVQAPPAEKEFGLSHFSPTSKLHATRTKIERLKFTGVDFHQHIKLAGEAGALPPEQIVAMMDAMNVAMMVHLTGGHGRALEQAVDQLVKPFPKRFVVFTELNWDHLQHDDFGVRMAADVAKAVAYGARGLKLLKWFGLGARHPDGGLVKVDDPRFDPVWQTCARLAIPVAIHTGDPEAFFDPVDERNERWEELQQHPQWSFHDAKWPRLPELLAARDRVFARHPKTTFVALHVGGWPENLDYVSDLLRDCPNVYVDIGGREAELGRQPLRAETFFTQFADRILFGSDVTPAAWNEAGVRVYESYARTLETADEHYDYFGAPAQGRWRISGLGLPDDVLQKVYSKNAIAIFSQFGKTAQR